jgi:hypothetical protein
VKLQGDVALLRTMRRTVFSLALAGLFTVPVMAAESVVRQVEHKLSTSGVSRVFVEFPLSSLKIRNTTGSTAFVSGTIERDFVTGRGEKKAKEILDDTDVELSMRGRSLYIRPKLGPAARGFLRSSRDSKFRLTIDLPQNVDLQIDQSVGQLDLTGSYGNVEMNMSVGDIKVRMPRDGVRELMASASIGEVRTNLGERIVTAEGFFAGSTHFINDAGRSTVKVKLRVGDADIELTD